jgi:hypothetical protein
MWQGGNNTESFIFRSTLMDLYNNTISNSTWRLLLTKYKQNLTANKVAKFNNII